MGSIQKTAVINGKSLNAAFKSLQKSDAVEYGTDCYNGGWNNCQGVKEVTAAEFNRRVNESDISKHEPAIAKCVKKAKVNSNTIKTQVDRFPNKGTRKWVTRYVAYAGFFGYEPTNISELSQAEAVKKAREFVNKNPEVRLTIKIEKVLDKQETKVAVIKYKPSKGETDGEWEIYGCMSY